MNRVLLVVSLLIFSDLLPAQSYKPGDHEVFFMPTAKTMPQGSSYFTDYEVLFLNYTYAATNSTHVGVFTVFPYYKEFFETFSLGIKQNIYAGENFGNALFGTVILREGVFVLGDVFSFGDDSKSINAAFGAAGGGDIDELEFIFMLGGNIYVSESIAIMAEFSTTGAVLDTDTPGIISLGVRFRGENTSWELAGVRPLGETDDDLLLFPSAKRFSSQSSFLL